MPHRTLVERVVHRERGQRFVPCVHTEGPARSAKMSVRASRVLVGALAASVLMIGAVPAGAVTTESSIRPETAFADVSCTSVNNCTAVGSFGQPESAPFEDPTQQPVHATETDGVWGRAVVVTAPGGNPGVFTSVSCYAVGSCTAVGYTYSGGFDLHGGEATIGYPLYETETNGRWGPVRELTIATGSFTNTVGGLFSVSCGSAASCVAVGAGEYGLAALVATESNGTFGPANFVATPTGTGYFDSVSCTTATDCTAVGGDTVFDGDYGIAFANAPIAATETAGTWGSAAEVDAKANLLSLGATSCAAPSTCTAVSGSSYVTETAGTWGPARKVVWTGTGGVSLFGIDCSSSADCTAVGESASGAFGTIGTVSVHLTERGGVWGSVKADGGGVFSDVSCPTATTCTSVGDFDLCVGVAECNSKSVDPVYTAETAGVWPAVPRPPSIRRVTPLDGRATVSWTASAVRGGPPVLGYTAVATLQTGGGTSEFTCTSTTTRCTVPELTDGQTYTIAVVARNSVGSSIASSSRTSTPNP